MKLKDRIQQSVVVFDGAMGTQIQELTLPDEVWRGQDGCNEILNLSAAQSIYNIHRAYLEAGSDVVSTNTFGASELVLAEYALQDQVEEINAAAAQIARRAITDLKAELDDNRPRFVAGSMGPGTKLISLGQTDPDTLYNAYYRQATGLIDGGVDLLLIETCQDLLQIKTVLRAARDALQKSAKPDVLVGVSVTIETTGTLLVGSEIGAVLATLDPFAIDLLGINCATGPEPMRPFVQQICEQFSGPVLVQPNAGLPKNVDGRVQYPLQPEAFAQAMADMVNNLGVQLVGGCCGTTPTHINKLAKTVAGGAAKSRTPRFEPSISSLFRSTTLTQEPAPFFVAERCNANGSKKFCKLLLAEDWDGLMAVAKGQERGGAHGLDLCVAYTGRDELVDSSVAVPKIATQNTLPLFIDSTNPQVIEASLKLYGGRPVINSVNLEAGEEKALAICQLAKRYGAALIALTIDEQGMAMEVDRKLQVAQRLYDLAVVKTGLRPQDLIFDALTFTLGSGDPSLRPAGQHTLDAIRQIKAKLEGVYTLLGVSNISFGLNPAAREVLNSVFLGEAVKAGLDMAIVNPKKIMPLYQIDQTERRLAMELIENQDSDKPLFTYIEHFENKKGGRKKRKVSADLPLSERIQNAVIEGIRAGLPELLDQQRQQMRAIDIINQLLVPAMRTVGELFGAGEMQLPFVLQAAEVMKLGVDHLEPFLERTDQQVQKSIVLATVRGDVHDIGKNLVDIILSNNGYKVYNIGINCEIETMLSKAQEVGADAIGMSGLLVKSTAVMMDNLREMQRRQIQIPVLLGGAALTRQFVDDQCAKQLSESVLYCADAFAGLTAMQQLAEGRLSEYVEAQRAKFRARAKPRPRVVRRETGEQLRHDIAVPKPPFLGRKVVTQVDLDRIFSYLNLNVLFRGRWGYRRGRMEKDKFEAQLQNHVQPELQAMQARCKEQAIFVPQVVYGYYECFSRDTQLVVLKPNTTEELTSLQLPRQKKEPHRSIADFFKSQDSGQLDLLAVQVVTIGQGATELEQRLYADDRYKEYMLWHGLGVETAEALAEYWHEIVREELAIQGDTSDDVSDLVHQRYRGSRYSFGYPACPDLEENAKLCELLQAEEIGVTLSVGAQMVPEQTTSAFIVHHPQAKYFTL